jgi:hypothetical protein
MVLTVNENDLLEQDPVIRGQSYACVSFLSPEETIKKKENFYMENFIQHFSKHTNELFDGIENLYLEKSDEIRSIKEQYQHIFKPEKINEEYHDFVKNNETVLDSEFNQKYDFQTNVRGIKIRGVYESVSEATLRCEQLRKLDKNKFSIYVCEVGCWCPWSPNPDSVKNQEYAIDSLNTMMQEYEKNVETKNEHFAERKAELKNRIKNNEDSKAQKNTDIDTEPETNTDTNTDTNIDDKLEKAYDINAVNEITDSLDKAEPWTRKGT